MCCHYFCCCEAENSEPSLGNLWLSGRFKRTEAVTVETPPKRTEITTIEVLTNEPPARNDLQEINAPVRKSSFTPSSPNTASIVSKESYRNSRLSDSTFGDISRIDVRLNLFEDEDRFRDISEAIFKKHS